MPDKQLTSFITDILRFGLERLSLVPVDKRSFEVQDAIAAQELAVDVLSTITASSAEETKVLEGPPSDVNRSGLYLDGESLPPAGPIALIAGVVDEEIQPMEEEASVQSKALVLARPGNINARSRQIRTRTRSDHDRMAILNTKPSLASRFPHELLLTIFDYIDRDDTEDLYSCCLVSRHWSPPAQESLWRCVALDSAWRVRKFVRGVAFSGTRKPTPIKTPSLTLKSLSGSEGWSTVGGLISKRFGEVVGSASRNSATVPALPAKDILSLEAPSSQAKDDGSRLVQSTDSVQASADEIAVDPVQKERTDMPWVQEDTGLATMVKKLVVSSSEPKVILLQHVSKLFSNLQSLTFQHLACGPTGTPLEARVLTALECLIPKLWSLQIEDVDLPIWPDLLRILRTHGGNLRNLNIEAVGEIDAFESSEDMREVFGVLEKLEFLRLDGVPVGPNESVSSLVLSCPWLKAVTLDYCLDVSMDIFSTIWNGCPNLQFLGLAGVVGPLSAQLKLVTHYSLQTLRLVDCDVSDVLFEAVAREAVNLRMLRLVFEDDGCDGIVTVSSELTDRTLNAIACNMRTLTTLALTRCKEMTPHALGQVLVSNPVKTLDLHKHPECSIGGFDNEFLMCLAPFMENVEVLNLYGQQEIVDDSIAAICKRGAWKSVRSLCLNGLDIGGPSLTALRAGVPLLRRLSLVDCKRIGATLIKAFAAGDDLTDIEDDENPTRAAPAADGSSAGGTAGDVTLTVASVCATPAETSSTVLEASPPEKDTKCNITIPAVKHLPYLNRVYTLASGLSAEKSALRRTLRLYDAWFVDEGLDILSLWEAVVTNNVKVLL
ncbi:hypothetical protein HDU85_007486 [Gaertneriomyces sp. JEL0708]|nr:hypothetical protein HDU85_007486 [Gaertneriomyces sp. JEL0708]